MKRICIVTGESVLGGGAKTGVGELCDSIAYTLSRDYDVKVITPDGPGSFAEFVPGTAAWKEGIRKARMFGIDYYLITGEHWEDAATETIAELAPDILHNFAEPGILAALAERPARAIYTIDNAELVEDPEALRTYDAITTVSENYAKQIMESGSSLAEVLGDMPFTGITNGILANVMDPAKGTLITAKFSTADMSGKARCKAAICKAYGLDSEKWLAVMLCRLVEEKGIAEVIQSVPKIKALGGEVLLVGTAMGEYAETLLTLANAGDIVWVRPFPHPSQCLQIVAAGDFYLSPSVTEPCGLMQMTACRYGCVPITTLAGGLADNMTEDIAVIIQDDLSGSVEEAAALYENTEALAAKRKAAMERDFGWETRIAPYIELYEGEDA